jgi:DNA-binding response OmpR family regulator
MLKIVAVDDHAEILTIIKTKLSRNGYEVETLIDATQALSKVREIMPDLVLLDIMMPKLTGFDICGEIKSDPKLQHIKVVFLTAKDIDFARQKAEELKADGFIAKPFSPKELLAYINDLLDVTE